MGGSKADAKFDIVRGYLHVLRKSDGEIDPGTRHGESPNVVITFFGQEPPKPKDNKRQLPNGSVLTRLEDVAAAIEDGRGSALNTSSSKIPKKSVAKVCPLTTAFGSNQENVVAVTCSLSSVKKTSSVNHPRGPSRKRTRGAEELEDAPLSQLASIFSRETTDKTKESSNVESTKTCSAKRAKRAILPQIKTSAEQQHAEAKKNEPDA